jgi:hypothetical protein
MSGRESQAALANITDDAHDLSRPIVELWSSAPAEDDKVSERVAIRPETPR